MRGLESIPIGATETTQLKVGPYSSHYCIWFYTPSALAAAHTFNDSEVPMRFFVRSTSTSETLLSNAFMNSLAEETCMGA